LVTKKNAFEATLYDLLVAYAAQRQRRAITNVQIAKRHVWSLKQAREILTRLVGFSHDWTPLDRFLIAYLTTPAERATARASTFAASLELVREGALEIRQIEPFGDIYLRRGPKAVEVSA